MKKLLWVVLIFGLNGCATMNFSANYYTPPPNYKNEVINALNELETQLCLRFKYNFKIVSDNESKTKGIPEISGTVIKMPDNFIKYVYQNYYNDRFTVLGCVASHEICHREYNLPDKPTQTHFQVDKKAIQLLKDKTDIPVLDYYKSMFVMRNYWFSRKGVAGHTFNIGWNAIQAASLALGGPAVFTDWFATDMEKRLKLLSKEYKIRPRTCFKISKKS